MKVGDMIRVKQLKWMDAPGYFLQILSIDEEGNVGIIILSGSRLGQTHTIHPNMLEGSPSREFEVISESR
jgi:hypothetical protein